MTGFDTNNREADLERGTNEPGKRPQRQVGLQTFVGTFSSSSIMLGISVFQGIILARLLGPAGRGQYAAIMLWPTILTYIGLWGIHLSVGRLAAKVSDVGSVFRSGVLLALLTGLLTAGISYFLLPFLIPADQHEDLLLLSRIYLLFIPMAQLISNLAAVDLGSGNFFRLNIIRVLRGPLYLLCLGVIYLSGSRELLWFLCAMLITEAAGAVSRFLWMAKDYGIKGGGHSFAEIVKGGFRFGIAEVFQQGYQHIDKGLLLWLVDSKDMGLYVVGISAGMVLRIITNSMGTVGFAMTAQSDDKEGFCNVGHMFRKAIILLVLAGVCFAFAMPILILIVYGRSFLGAVNPAIILLVGSAFAGLAFLLESCMRGQGKPFAGMMGKITTIIIMLVFGVAFSKIWGLIGIATAFSIGQFVYVLTLMVQVVMHYHDARMKDFLPRYKDISDLVNLGLKGVGYLKAKVYKS